mmetsp:Transcript_33532/g.95803  ORF Transcript_33532/g.95803 Transcript_33532/m.95803 type:complete len:202 (+) Transcript_33532:188-793(+)
MGMLMRSRNLSFSSASRSITSKRYSSVNGGLTHTTEVIGISFTTSGYLPIEPNRHSMCGHLLAKRPLGTVAFSGDAKSSKSQCWRISGGRPRCTPLRRSLSGLSNRLYSASSLAISSCMRAFSFSSSFSAVGAHRCCKVWMSFCKQPILCRPTQISVSPFQHSRWHKGSAWMRRIRSEILFRSAAETCSRSQAGDAALGMR